MWPPEAKVFGCRQYLPYVRIRRTIERTIYHWFTEQNKEQEEQSKAPVDHETSQQETGMGELVRQPMKLIRE